MTKAVTLANLASGEALTIDETNDRIGIASTAPSASVDVNQTILLDGNSGVVTATSFSGDGSSLTGVAATDTIAAASLTVSGITTLTGVVKASSDVRVTGNLNAGIVTGTSFSGDGSALTGIAATDNINTNNIKISGITTLGTTTTIGIGKSINYNNVQKAFISDHAVGLGSTTTAGRNAGLGTASGTIQYNDTLKQICYYAGDTVGWVGISSTNNEAIFDATGGTKSVGPTHTIHAFTSTGPSTFVISGNVTKNYSIFVVAGGGGGAQGSSNGGYGGGGGGAGGIAYHPALPLSAGTYQLSVGGGGSGGTNNTSGGNAGDGTDSTFDPGGSNPFVANGGGAGMNNNIVGESGGSGGGSGSSPGGGESGGSSTGNSAPTPGGITYGNAGGASISPAGDAYWGGGGGGAGEAGKPGGNRPSWPQDPGGSNYAAGGDGIGSPSIPWLPTSHGDSSYFAGGGAGAGWSDSGPANDPGVVPGGNGGGADSRFGTPLGTLSAATANTGGGGAGGNGSPSANGTAGGSGIVLIRYENQP